MALACPGEDGLTSGPSGAQTAVHARHHLYCLVLIALTSFGSAHGDADRTVIDEWAAATRDKVRAKDPMWPRRRARCPAEGSCFPEHCRRQDDRFIPAAPPMEIRWTTGEPSTKSAAENRGDGAVTCTTMARTGSMRHESTTTGHVRGAAVPAHSKTVSPTWLAKWSSATPSATTSSRSPASCAKRQCHLTVSCQVLASLPGPPSFALVRLWIWASAQLAERAGDRAALDRLMDQPQPLPTGLQPAHKLPQAPTHQAESLIMQRQQPAHEPPELPCSASWFLCPVTGSQTIEHLCSSNRSKTSRFSRRLGLPATGTVSPTCLYLKYTALWQIARRTQSSACAHRPGWNYSGVERRSSGQRDRTTSCF